jgi:GLPGLI family protein
MEVATELLVGNNLSSFHSINKYQRDSAFMKSSFKTGIAKSFGSINETNFEVHKRPDKITTYETIDGSHLNIGNEVYVHEESPLDFNWNILVDTTTIHGLFCQMAQTSYAGRTWTAWFATSIPIMDGPYKFFGLPGLIVSIHDQDRYFQFDLASIDQVKKPIFTQESLRPDLNLIRTTRKDFVKQRQFYKDNMVEIAIALGFELSEVDKRGIKDEVKKQNNAIEK